MFYLILKLIGFQLLFYVLSVLMLIALAFIFKKHINISTKKDMIILYAFSILGFILWFFYSLLAADIVSEFITKNPKVNPKLTILIGVFFVVPIISFFGKDKGNEKSKRDLVISCSIIAVTYFLYFFNFFYLQIFLA